ncbi:MAG: hypothetical protein GY719_09035 [bacterium]|nr:hypothetical protein [bacterium]
MLPKPNRRLPRRFPVRFRPIGEREAQVGYSTNISQTGMFVATMRPEKPGTELDLEVAGKEHKMRLDAVVVHARKVPAMWQRLRPSGMGVRFLEPGESVEGLRQVVGTAGSLL